MSQKDIISQLLENADRQQLTALIEAQCQKDQKFRGQVLSALEEDGTEELKSIKKTIRSRIREYSQYGMIDESECDSISSELFDALSHSDSRAAQGQYEQAMEISLFVLSTGMELIETADDGSGLLGDAIEGALDAVEQAAKGLAESGRGRTKYVEKVLAAARSPVFNGWSEYSFKLLQRAAPLADAQSESAFYEALDCLDEASASGEWKSAQSRFTRYYILRAARGPEAARDYLSENLDVDELRLIQVQEDMELGNYAGAEQLCRERMQQDPPVGDMWSRPTRWQYLLYDIYRDWGQREKQIQQARTLTLLGDRSFYQTAKNLLTEDGRWKQEYPQFLEEIKAARPIYYYMEALCEEGETAALMEQVRLHPEMVYQYGNVLAQEYADEIYALCIPLIRAQAKEAGNRKEYQNVCGRIRALFGFGGTTQARELIAELRNANLRRPAMKDELEQVEKYIISKMSEQKP